MAHDKIHNGGSMSTEVKEELEVTLHLGKQVPNSRTHFFDTSALIRYITTGEGEEDFPKLYAEAVEAISGRLPCTSRSIDDTLQIKYAWHPTGDLADVAQIATTLQIACAVRTVRTIGLAAFKISIGQASYEARYLSTFQLLGLDS